MRHVISRYLEACRAHVVTRRARIAATVDVRLGPVENAVVAGFPLAGNEEMARRSGGARGG